MRAAAKAVAIAGVAAAVVACGTSGAATRSLRPSGSSTTSTTRARHRPPLIPANNRVLVIGDSLTYGSTNQVKAALAAAGKDPYVYGIVFTTIEHWAVHMADLEATFQPGSIIVELGTNDCLHPDAACLSVTPAIEQLVSAVPASTPIWWLNVQEQKILPVYARLLNMQLGAAARRHRNMTIVDMNARFADHPEWHASDQVHFNPAGAEQLAELMAGALAATG